MFQTSKYSGQNWNREQENKNKAKESSTTGNAFLVFMKMYIFWFV